MPKVEMQLLDVLKIIKHGMENGNVVHAYNLLCDIVKEMEEREKAETEKAEDNKIFWTHPGGGQCPRCGDTHLHDHQGASCMPTEIGKE